MLRGAGVRAGRARRRPRPHHRAARRPVAGPVERADRGRRPRDLGAPRRADPGRPRPRRRPPRGHRADRRRGRRAGAERRRGHSHVLCYDVDTREQAERRAGKARLRVSLVRVGSRVTRSTAELGVAVLHLGEHHLWGGVRPVGDLGVVGVDGQGADRRLRRRRSVRGPAPARRAHGRLHLHPGHAVPRRAPGRPRPPPGRAAGRRRGPDRAHLRRARPAHALPGVAGPAGARGPARGRRGHPAPAACSRNLAPSIRRGAGGDRRGRPGRGRSRHPRRRLRRGPGPGPDRRPPGGAPRRPRHPGRRSRGCRRSRPG